MKIVLDDIEIEEPDDGIREMQIEQVLAGLQLMPEMLCYLRNMANRGDEIAAEVVRRHGQL